MIARRYHEASFLLNCRTADAAFVTGSLAGLAVDYCEGRSVVLQEALREYAEEVEEQARKDWQRICVCIDELSSQRAGTSPPKPDDGEDAIAGLQRYAVENWQVVSTTLELTKRCNLDCGFCYLDNHESDGLDLAVYERIADQLVAEGVVFVMLTGGEAFLRSDILDIMEALSGKGLAFEVKSNGTVLTEEMVERVGHCSVFDFQVSIYGHREGFDPVLGAYYDPDRVMENVSLLNACGVPVTLSVLVGKHNIDELDRLHGLIRSRLPNRVIWSAQFSPRRDASVVPTQYRLTYGELETAFRPFLQSVGEKTERRKYRECAHDRKVCTAGQEEVVISTDGEVYPCLDMPVSLGNILHTPLRDILSTRRERLGHYTFGSLTPCQACDLREYCDSCIGMNGIENGDWRSPTQHRCDLARFYHQ